MREKLLEIRDWLTLPHFIITVAVIVGLIVGGNVLYSKFGPDPGIDLSKCITIDVAGYDTYGKATLNVNQDVLDKYLEKYTSTKGHSYTFKLSKESEISNGNMLYVEVFEDGKDITSDYIKGRVASDESVTDTASKETVTGAEGDSTNNDYVNMDTSGSENTDTSDASSKTESEKTDSSSKSTTKVKSSQSSSQLVKFKDMSVKVSGLKECTNYSASQVFSKVSVTFAGASPELTVRVENKSDDKFLKYLSYESDKKTESRTETSSP